MKKLLLSLIIVLGGSIVTFGQTRIGILTGFGTETDTPGLGVNGEFFFGKRSALAPGFFSFFPDDRGNFKYTRSEVDVDFHYYFFPDGGVHLYGLAGLNFTTAKVKFDNGATAKDSELGINMGFGINIEINHSRVLPFAEFKYEYSGDIEDQGVLFLGAKISF